MTQDEKKTKPPNHDNPQNIVKALIKKSKKSFSNKDDSLGRLAANISPSYRDYIYKIISNCSLKIKSGSSSYILGSGQETGQSSLNKRQKNFISIELSDLDALPHELGHAVDFWFGMSQPLTCSLILSNGMVLWDVFDQEFESVHEKVFHEMMDKYKSILDSKIDKNAFDIIIKNVSGIRKLNDMPFNPKYKTNLEKRREIQNKLYASGFVDAYYELITNDFSNKINEDYGPVLDALSSKYDLSFLNLVYHDIGYYQSGLGTKPVQEFFANLFEAKVTSNQAQLDNSAKYFPESVKAFEELFSIIFDHIENNKRFTDVKIRKGATNDLLQGLS